MEQPFLLAKIHKFQWNLIGKNSKFGYDKRIWITVFFSSVLPTVT